MPSDLGHSSRAEFLQLGTVGICAGCFVVGTVFCLPGFLSATLDSPTWLLEALGRKRWLEKRGFQQPLEIIVCPLVLATPCLLVYQQQRACTASSPCQRLCQISSVSPPSVGCKDPKAVGQNKSCLPSAANVTHFGSSNAKMINTTNEAGQVGLTICCSWDGMTPVSSRHSRSLG